MLCSSEGNCKLKCPEINGHSIPCEILKIIQINKINEQINIKTLYIAFHFPFSSRHFLLSLNTEPSKKFDRNYLTAGVFLREKVVYPDLCPGTHVFVTSTETPNSLIHWQCYSSGLMGNLSAFNPQVSINT